MITIFVSSTKRQTTYLKVFSFQLNEKGNSTRPADRLTVIHFNKRFDQISLLSPLTGCRLVIGRIQHIVDN